jgi:hypothetical protein
MSTLISNLYKIKWELLTDKDPNAIHHAANYVTKAKELEKKIEVAEMHLFDEEEEEQENV